MKRIGKLLGIAVTLSHDKEHESASKISSFAREPFDHSLHLLSQTAAYDQITLYLTKTFLGLIQDKFMDSKKILLPQMFHEMLSMGKMEAEKRNHWL